MFLPIFFSFLYWKDLREVEIFYPLEIHKALIDVLRTRPCFMHGSWPMIFSYRTPHQVYKCLSLRFLTPKWMKTIICVRYHVTELLENQGNKAGNTWRDRWTPIDTWSVGITTEKASWDRFASALLLSLIGRALPSQPIRRKAKAKRDLATRVFPCFWSVYVVN